MKGIWSGPGTRREKGRGHDSFFTTVIVAQTATQLLRAAEPAPAGIGPPGSSFLPMKAIDPQLAGIRAAEKCVRTALGRNQRAYGQPQAERMIQGVALVMTALSHAKNNEERRDQLVEMFRIASALNAIHQGVIP